MTLNKPSYFLRRLQILAHNTIVYDQVFRKGLNVLWGANASGKTTVLQFIYFAMGGKTPNWKPIAKSCEGVFAELIVNDQIITTYREYRPQQFAPMSIFYGTLEEAKLAPINDWFKFPYSRGKGSSGKESFSQVLFNALDMPYVPVKDANVTMYQVLRLAYQNQLTSPEKLFRDDDFDSKLVKQTVGDFLCGVFNPQLYENQLLVRELTKSIQSLSGEQSGLKDALGVVGEDFDIAGIANEQRSVISELEEIRERLSKLIFDTEGQETAILADQKVELAKLKKSLDKNNIEMSKQELEISSLEFQLIENSDFVASLQSNLIALEKSDWTRQAIGEMNFDFCPQCLAPVKESSPESCRLCKTHLDDGLKNGHRLRLKRELQMQISESEKISESIVEELRMTKQTFAKLVRESKKQQHEYVARKTIPVSATQVKIQELSERTGYLGRQLEILEDRLRIGQRIDLIIAKLIKLKATKGTLDEKIKLGLSAQTQAKNRSKALITKYLVELLNRDLPREDSFANIKSISFDFGEEKISVNGLDRFAASSSVYLKNCFGLAMLLASMEDLNFRFPRLLILDAIEDKGLEEERIHNFHELVKEYSENATAQHQIILTSQTLADSLQDEKYIIDKRYLKGDHSLSFPTLMTV